MFLEFFAPAGVKSARDKKECDDSEIDEISHVGLQFMVPGSAGVSPALNCLPQGTEPAGRQRSQVFVFTGQI